MLSFSRFPRSAKTLGRFLFLSSILAIAPSAGCDSASSPNPANSDLGSDLAGVTAPTLASILPGTATVSGGTPVVVYGTGFNRGATVKFAGTLATAITVNTDQQITATVPAYTGPLGAVEVLVQNPDGGSVARSDLFAYARVPVGFAASVSRTVGTQPYAIVAEDLNGDGGRELVVANRSSSDVTVLLSGLSLQSAGATYPTASTPIALAVADISGDGIKDVVVGCSNASSQDVDILRGAGNGSLLAPIHVAVGMTATGVIAKDLDGDGKIDIAVSVRSTGKVVILRNTGSNPNVSFAGPPYPSYSVGNQPVSLLLADLNKDGRDDLISANYSDNQVGVLLGGTGATFQMAVKVSAVGSSPQGLAAGILTGDGNIDVVTTNLSASSLSILKGKGDGTFASVTSLASGPSPTAAALADFDGDGKLDIAVANSGYNSVWIYLGKGDGSFEPAQKFAVGVQPYALVAVDLNGDGKPDVATANLGDNTVTILYNTTTR